MPRIINVSPADISLVTQKHQRRHIMLQVLNRDWNREFDLHGDTISCTVSNDETNAIRRTASLSMKISDADINKAMALTMNHYIKILIGIEDNRTKDTKWWSQGVFIINKDGLNLGRDDKTLSLELSDKMLDFTGDRKGKLHAYNTIIENSQRFDIVMKNLIETFGGCKKHDITCIHPKRTQALELDITKDQDYLIPYTMEFPTGTTIYEILEKLVTAYPDWEIFFDADGVFVCQSKVREGDNMGAALDDTVISELKISETPTIFDVSKTKNVIEVWGKDGNYYGEARDEDIESPFNVAAIGEIREVFSGGNYDNIYDRYKDVKKHYDNLAEQNLIEEELGNLDYSTSEGSKKKTELIQKLKTLRIEAEKNIKYRGNDLARQWAESLLASYARTNSTTSLTLVNCPFFNETGFKISYRNEAYKKIMLWICTAINHDYSANTTTLTLSRLYDDTSEYAHVQLPTPIISEYSASGLTLSVTVDKVQYATKYILYLNGKLLATSVSPTMIYTFDDSFTGEYEISVAVAADRYSNSNQSDCIYMTINNGEITLS